MSVLIMKFGGTSVGSRDAIEQVISIIAAQREQWDSLVIVTSAMGGVTNTLVQLVDAAGAGWPTEDQLLELRHRHERMLEHLVDSGKHAGLVADTLASIDALLDILRETCHEIAIAGGASPAQQDIVLSMGERLMARILACIVHIRLGPAHAIDASEVLVTNTRHQNAEPLYDQSIERAQVVLVPLLREGVMPVVTGYIGATREGKITTLGRGGSDYSAAYIARLLNADEVWIWTDVDGVMSADPRRIKEARVIKTISFGEVSEFAHFGAKVLHPRTVEPLISAQISLRVRNTFAPLEPGTLIGQQDGDTPRHLSAVTAIGGVLVFVPARDLDLLDAIQSLLSEFFYVPARAVISVDSHAGRLLCYIVPTTAHHDTRERAVAAATEMLNEADVLPGWRVEPIDIVAAIGVVSIQQTVQVLNAVKSVKAELLAMGQGSPQCSLLAVRPNHVLRVIRRLHRMVLAVQANLDYAETDPYAPPSLSVPANRRRRQGRQRNNRLNPPDRAIPL